MRIIFFLFILCISSSVFAADTTNNIQGERALQNDTKKLIQDAHTKVGSIKDREARQYLFDVLEFQENIINNALSMDYGYAQRGYRHSLDERKGYYTEYLKPLYESIRDAGTITAKIDPKVRESIESTTVGYQKEFISYVRESLQKYILSDIFQKGNMSFAYEGSGGYIKVRISDYESKTSISRDEQEIHFQIFVDMDMQIPGKETCDYDYDTWEYTCSTSSGSHIRGNASLKMSTWQVDDIQYMQMHDFSLQPQIDGVDAADLQAAIAEIKKYTDNKVYTYTVPSYGIRQSDIFEKALEVLDVLDTTSIFTPRIQIGDEYAMMFNPVFVDKINEITGSVNEGKKTQTLLPELRYKDGTYTVYYPTSTMDIYTFRLGKNTTGATSFGFHVSTYQDPAYLSGSISKNAWDIHLHVPDEIEIVSIWDGSTTKTLMTGKGVGELYDALMGVRRYDDEGALRTDIGVAPKKIEISGALRKTDASISLLVDDTTVGYFTYAYAGEYMTYLGWIRAGIHRMEIIGDIQEKLGKYSVQPPKDNLIHLDEDEGVSLSQSLSEISSNITP